MESGRCRQSTGWDNQRRKNDTEMKKGIALLAIRLTTLGALAVSDDEDRPF